MLAAKLLYAQSMNLARKTLFMLFRLIARYRLAQLGAVVLMLTSRRLDLARNVRRGAKRYRALVMQRTGFLQDVEESFREGGDFDVISWSSFALKAFAAEILDPSLDHNNYISGDSRVDATKMEYRRFLADLWRRFRTMKPVDVVLTGNFAYFTEREFAVALEQAGTPFIALHKENVRPPRRVQEYWFTLYKDRRGKFGGRRILVYNEIERELEICRRDRPWNRSHRDAAARQAASLADQACGPGQWAEAANPVLRLRP